MKKRSFIFCMIMSIVFVTACGSDGEDGSDGNLIAVERIEAGDDEALEMELEDEQDGQTGADMESEDKAASQTEDGASNPAGKTVTADASNNAAGNTPAGNAGKDDAQAVGKKAAESKGGDEAMMAAYVSVLEGIYFSHQFPDGKDYGFDSNLNLSENQFAVCDIDEDGRDELVISYTTTFYGGMVGIVYGYDKGTGAVREELLEFPAMTFYDNGVVEVESSHNHGLAGDISSDEFWPYTLYQYNKESDTYQETGSVDAWSKAFSEKDSKGNSFPDAIDADGDGLVYFIPSQDKPVDKEEYTKWRNDFIGGAGQLTIPFKSLTEENIAELLGSKGETVKSSEPSFYGTWKVKDFQAAEVSALSEDEIKAFLNDTVTYQEDAVYLNGKNQNIANLGYEYSHDSEEELVQNYRVNLGEWWDGKETVVCARITSTENFFGSQFFIADEETLWIYYEGVFFLAKKE